MLSVINPIERIRQLPGAFVDINFGQNDLWRYRQQWARSSGGEIGSEESAAETIEISKEMIADLSARTAPFKLPEDYLFFLEYYGGLNVSIENAYHFEIQGVGPSALLEYWEVAFHNWGERIGSALPGRGGLIVGSLQLQMELTKAKALGVKTEALFAEHDNEVEYVPEKWILFRMDLAGVIHKYGIIGLGPNETGNPHPLSFGDGETSSWQKLANSFSEWLEIAADTRGLFGYSYVDGIK
jgi:hypothetical protein